jgi:alpha-1,3-fucosyltransferase
MLALLYISEVHHHKLTSVVRTAVTGWNSDANGVTDSKGFIKQYKSILIWNNSPKVIETAIFGFGHDPFVLEGCEFSDCAIFNQDSAASLPLEEFDAVIVQISTMWLSDSPENRTRSKHQRFIFFAQESPASMRESLPDIFSMRNYFNWTMSYRSNSDIQFLYGRIQPGPTAPKTREETLRLMKANKNNNKKNYAANKIKLVAWMVGHCDTLGLREIYVSQLAKFIPIDVYGKCGNMSCSRNTMHAYSDPQCYQMLEAKYKFYLSFENSICEEYVTEKFFEIANRDIVPIVYGGADYQRIAPPHSFIDALEFTPEALAQYLTILDANDELYNEFFWWKSHYKVEAGLEQMARHGFCDLCKKLHQDQVPKFYPELETEWDPKNKCWEN